MAACEVNRLVQGIGLTGPEQPVKIQVLGAVAVVIDVR